ncbi:hypothetical protein Sxan_01750 [Streptomyces xanthophaeus]|uniref:Uncharacterized protein n=1 Tax=Streptomyces xanthophaeus TaxID=67385 RepID=A0A919GUE5_9ACTN|nr:hypothetical protein Sxan_01750 [Streptomyces xanthophaeus]
MAGLADPCASKKPRPEANPFRTSPTLICVTGRTGRQMKEETRMMVTGLVVVAALLVGACSWHLMRRYKGRS